MLARIERGRNEIRMIRCGSTVYLYCHDAFALCLLFALYIDSLTFGMLFLPGIGLEITLLLLRQRALRTMHRHVHLLLVL